MQWNPSNFLEQVQMCSTQVACLEELNRYRWENGLVCPKRRHDKSCQLKLRHLHKCTKYERQDLPTVWTGFVPTWLQLPKRFVAIYLIGSEQVRISTEQFFKMVDMALPIAYRMHRQQVDAILPEKVGESLLKVHIVVNNFKSFLAGIFHRVSHRFLQEKIDEIDFDFNRRFWEPQCRPSCCKPPLTHMPFQPCLTYSYRGTKF